MTGSAPLWRPGTSRGENETVDEQAVVDPSASDSWRRQRMTLRALYRRQQVGGINAVGRVEACGEVGCTQLDLSNDSRLVEPPVT